MADSLASEMHQLSLNAKGIEPSAFDSRLEVEGDGTFADLKPRKRARQNAEDLLTELENEFLAPSARFSTKWLNHLQKCVVILPTPFFRFLVGLA